MAARKVIIESQRPSGRATTPAAGPPICAAACYHAAITARGVSVMVLRWAVEGGLARFGAQAFLLRFFGFGVGSSRVVILASSLNHSRFSIWSSIK